ncbi:MAG: hypothetical protein ACOCW2_00520 [Chitinivibrionales bacterium]
MDMTYKEMARAYARETLAHSPSFHRLSLEEQKSLYTDLYKSRYNQLAQGQTVGGLPSRSGAPVSAMAKKASDMINDERHKNDRIEQAGELAGEFMDEVDFPGFVSDLLKGVFDANLEVTLKQMESYQTLLKTATASISKFINSIDDTAAFGYLAENNSDDFNIDFSDSETESNGQPKAILTNKDGEPVDIGDNQVKAKIMDAKIAMAKEQRALLRETILMGITRLVVEKGQVKASVLFDIKASEKINKADKAALKESISSGSSFNSSGGLFGKVFGGPSGGLTRSKRKTKISVSSAKSQASTDLAAKVTGYVDIQFKSDYFKLDNFAAMYGPVSDVDRQAAGVAGQQSPQAKQ